MISCDTPCYRLCQKLLRIMHYKDIREALTPLMYTCFLSETGGLVQACYAELCSHFWKSTMHDHHCCWWIITEGFGAQNGTYGGHSQTCYVASQQACPCIEHVFFSPSFSRISTWSSSRAARSAYLLSTFAIRSSMKCWLLKVRALHESAQSFAWLAVLVAAYRAALVSTS